MDHFKELSLFLDGVYIRQRNMNNSDMVGNWEEIHLAVSQPFYIPIIPFHNNSSPMPTIEVPPSKKPRVNYTQPKKKESVWKQYHLQACQALESKDYLTSSLLINKALKLVPNEWSLYALRAYLSLATKQRTKVFEDVRILEHFGFVDSRAFYEAAKILFSLDPPSALAMIERGEKIAYLNSTLLSNFKKLKRKIELHVHSSRAQKEEYELKRCDFMGILPLEVLRLILGQCNTSTILQCTRVCKSWREYLMNDKDLWSHIECPPKLSKNMFASLCHRGGRFIKTLTVPMAGCLNDKAIRKIKEAGCNNIETLQLSSLAKASLLGVENSLRVTSHNLHKLVLSRSSVDDKFVYHILQSCHNLEHLDLSFCVKIDGSCFGLFKNWVIGKRRDITIVNTLHEFVLEGLELLSDQRMRNLTEEFSKVTLFNLSGCKRLTTSTLYNLGNSSKLQDLDLSGFNQNANSVITMTTALLNLFSNCPDLKRFVLGKCQTFQDDGLAWLGSNCDHLEELDVFGCHYISDIGMVTLSLVSSSLVHLNLGGCVFLTNQGLCKLFRHCPRLKQLGLSQLPRISGQVLISLSEYCHQLQALDVSGCRGVDGESALLFLQRFRHFQFLDISGCPLISPDVVAAMKQFFPRTKLVCRLQI